MKTHTQALDVRTARQWIAARAFGAIAAGPPTPEQPGGIGLEPEYFVVRVDALGQPGGRPRLFRNEATGEAGIIDWLREASEDPELGFFEYVPGVVPRFELSCGGQLTFEPGAQVEHSTRVHENAAGAMEDLERVRAGLVSIFERHGCALVALGLDPWHKAESVPQQLPGGRYRSQAEFYASKGPAGAKMMRNSTSLQINLDFGGQFGDPKIVEERWRIANLVSPLITATFSTSPGADLCGSPVASRRARVWQVLDPSRTGFPPALQDGRGGDPALDYADKVLDAELMLYRRDGGPEGMHTALDGLTFRRWIEEGHATHGSATLEDLEYHLTTVFPEVRARGFMELRSADGLPRELAGPFVVLLSGLVYDPQARREALALLADHQHELEDLWIRAGRAGLEDPIVAGLAGWIWPLALEGAKRLPADYFRLSDLEATAAFLDRYVLDGASPSCELRDLLAVSPEAALTWGRKVTGA
ncbi:MAG: glutamate-cysteine ligase family protein [Planctomycetota bacterium]|nr:glutamate-cysteine ligase family protein [Planctomycetota bacterium]